MNSRGETGQGQQTHRHEHMHAVWLQMFKETCTGINYRNIYKEDFLLCPCEAEE